MSDLAACNGENCPLRETCLRHTMPREEYQWYTEGDYHDGQCSLYVHDETGETTDGPAVD